MTQYCLIEQVVITDGPRALPKVWRNVSGLNLLDDASLKIRGWLPCDDVPYPEYNKDTQHIMFEGIINEDTVTPVYTVVDFPEMYMTGLWCNVVVGEVVSGPVKLPRWWQGTELWMLTEAEVNAKEWLRYIDSPPAYDADLRYLTFVNTINADNVTATYTVNDYTAGEMVTRIADAKVARKVAIRREAQTVILADYPLWMQANVANGIYGSGIGDPMKAHIANVITESNTCEDAVDAAITLAAIRAIKPTWPEVI